MATFEAHITLPRESAEQVRSIATIISWSFSQFDADPVMGDKPFCYLTDYDPDPVRLRNRMGAAVAFLELDGVRVLRQKIERIIFDTKTGVDELSD